MQRPTRSHIVLLRDNLMGFRVSSCVIENNTYGKSFRSLYISTLDSKGEKEGRENRVRVRDRVTDERGCTLKSVEHMYGFVTVNK